MRKLFYLLIIAAGVYGVAYYVPPETKRQALAAVGLADFFQVTLPGYLRSKLSIPENPVAKREKLLGELSGAIGSIERELEAVSPVEINGSPLPQGKPPPPPKLPPAKEVQARIEKSRELLAESEEKLALLREENPKQGFVAKAAERVLDRVLPSPDVAPVGAGGVGGDAAGGVVCDPR